MMFLFMNGEGWEGWQSGDWSFFGSPDGLLSFLQGLLQAILDFLTNLPTWVTGV